MYQNHSWQEGRLSPFPGGPLRTSGLVMRSSGSATWELLSRGSSVCESRGSEEGKPGKSRHRRPDSLAFQLCGGPGICPFPKAGGKSQESRPLSDRPGLRLEGALNEASISESAPNTVASGPSVTGHNPAFSFCMFSQTHVKCNPRRPWPRHADTGNPRAQPLLNQNRQRLAGRPTLCMTPPSKWPERITGASKMTQSLCVEGGVGSEKICPGVKGYRVRVHVFWGAGPESTSPCAATQRLGSLGKSHALSCLSFSTSERRGGGHAASAALLALENECCF